RFVICQLELASSHLDALSKRSDSSISLDSLSDSLQKCVTRGITMLWSEFLPLFRLRRLDEIDQRPWVNADRFIKCSRRSLNVSTASEIKGDRVFERLFRDRLSHWHSPPDGRQSAR